MRLVVVLAVVLAACGVADQPEQPAARTPTPTEGPAGGEASIRGTFGGDAQLEGGCAWVEEGDTRWEVQWPPGYEVTFDPLTLHGPEGVAASDGDTLSVAGAHEPDAMTICQVGPVWAATAVTVGGG